MRKLAIFTLAFTCGALLGQYLLPREILPWAALGCALLSRCASSGGKAADAFCC